MIVFFLVILLVVRSNCEPKDNFPNLVFYGKLNAGGKFGIITDIESLRPTFVKYIDIPLRTNVGSSDDPTFSRGIAYIGDDKLALYGSYKYSNKGVPLGCVLTFDIKTRQMGTIFSNLEAASISNVLPLSDPFNSEFVLLSGININLSVEVISSSLVACSKITEECYPLSMYHKGDMIKGMFQKGNRLVFAGIESTSFALLEYGLLNDDQKIELWSFTNAFGKDARVVQIQGKLLCYIDSRPFGEPQLFLYDLDMLEEQTVEWNGVITSMHSLNTSVLVVTNYTSLYMFDLVKWDFVVTVTNDTKACQQIIDIVAVTDMEILLSCNTSKGYTIASYDRNLSSISSIPHLQCSKLMTFTQVNHTVYMDCPQRDTIRLYSLDLTSGRHYHNYRSIDTASIYDTIPNVVLFCPFDLYLVVCTSGERDPECDLWNGRSWTTLSMKIQAGDNLSCNAQGSVLWISVARFQEATTIRVLQVSVETSKPSVQAHYTSINSTFSADAVSLLDVVDDIVYVVVADSGPPTVIQYNISSASFTIVDIPMYNFVGKITQMKVSGGYMYFTGSFQFDTDSFQFNNITKLDTLSLSQWGYVPPLTFKPALLQRYKDTVVVVKYDDSHLLKWTCLYWLEEYTWSDMDDSCFFGGNSIGMHLIFDEASETLLFGTTSTISTYKRHNQYWAYTNIDLDGPYFVDHFGLFTGSLSNLPSSTSTSSSSSSASSSTSTSTPEGDISGKNPRKADSVQTPQSVRSIVYTFGGVFVGLIGVVVVSMIYTKCKKGVKYQHVTEVELVEALTLKEAQIDKA